MTAATTERSGTEVSAGRWLPLRGRADPDGLPLFCLPHAGGGASAFTPWIGRLPGVAVFPVQPPGREARYAEPAYTAMAELVSDLAPVILDQVDGRPYAVYGHSHGALIGFELIREIRRRDGPLPVRLFASGSVAPQCGSAEDGPPVSRMSRSELVGWLRRLGGTPEWLLSDPGALGMVLPAIQGDFAVRESYSYVEDGPLPVPMTTIAATHDRRVRTDLTHRWAELSSVGCEHRSVSGGHFAVYEPGAPTVRFILEDLAVHL